MLSIPQFLIKKGTILHEAMTISTLMETIGTMFTTAIAWVADVAEAVSSHPILLLGVLLPIIGLGIGFFKRLMHV